MQQFLAASPVFQAFSGSDFFGKLIFIGIWALSILSWYILIYRWKIIKRAKEHSFQFKQAFGMQKQQALNIQYNGKKEINPFFQIYSLMRDLTVAILSKNKKYGKQTDEGAPYLSHYDLDLIEGHISTAIGKEIQLLEKHLYLLPLTASLAPFLGLLGTAWGILVTFDQLRLGGSAFMSNDAVVGGLAMALGTTVLGLLVAIPALIGNSWLKNQIYIHERDMESFSSEILSAVEMQYRKVDLS